MNSVHVSRILLTAAFILGLTALAPAQADAEECFEVEFRSGPIKAGRYEYLACSVHNNVDETVEVEVELVDSNDEEVTGESFELGNDEFDTLIYRVFGYTGEELVCEVEIELCFENSGTSAVEEVDSHLIKLMAFPPLHGELKRRGPTGRYDIATSALRMIEIED